jgi:hypothetical protein
MNKLAAIAVSTATFALVSLNAGVASASGGGSASGAWPAAYPLPTSPGTVVSQSAAKAVVRSTDTVAAVKTKLDDLYVTELRCSLRLVVDKPNDYLCRNAVTGNTTEIYFTFAALDPTATSPSHSQTNAFIV